MTLPDPREKPWLTVTEAAALVGLGRDAGYGAVNRGQIPSIRLGDRIIVPTAAWLAKLGLDDRDDQAVHVAEALTASALELRAAAEDVDRAMGHLNEAVAGARQLARLLARNSEAGPTSPATATDDRTGPGHESASHIIRAI